MPLLDKIYLLIITLCAIASVLNPVSRQQKLWIYFLTVCFAEIYAFFFENTYPLQIYRYSVIIYCLYWSYYFLYKKNTGNFLFYFFSMLSILIFSFDMFFSKKYFDSIPSIYLIIFYQTLSIQYLYSEIRTPNEIPIYKKQKFWISISLTLWSMVFTFYIVPVHFLLQTDILFESIIEKIFHYTTIFSYILFLIGLLCKKE